MPHMHGNVSAGVFIKASKFATYSKSSLLRTCKRRQPIGRQAHGYVTTHAPHRII